MRPWTTMNTDLATCSHAGRCSLSWEQRVRCPRGVFGRAGSAWLRLLVQDSSSRRSCTSRTHSRTRFTRSSRTRPRDNEPSATQGMGSSRRADRNSLLHPPRTVRATLRRSTSRSRLRSVERDRKVKSFLRLELKAHRIHTVPLACFRRTIIEHVPQV